MGPTAHASFVACLVPCRLIAFHATLREEPRTRLYVEPRALNLQRGFAINVIRLRGPITIICLQGNYGAFLLPKPQLCEDIVATMSRYGHRRR